MSREPSTEQLPRKPVNKRVVVSQGVDYEKRTLMIFSENLHISATIRLLTVLHLFHDVTLVP